MLNRYKDQFTLFLELGFIAVNHADESSAVKLFTAAEMLRPDEVLTVIGFGYLHLCKLEVKSAIDMFEKALKKEPNNPIAKSLLGFCFALTPDHVKEGTKLLEDMKAQANSKDIKELDNVLLGFVDKFVKKEPSSSHKRMPHHPPR